MMQKIRWFFLIAVIVLVLVVALQNNHQTQVHLLLHERSLPLSMLLLSTTAIGFLFGALITASMLRSGRKVAAEKKAKKVAPATVPTEEPAPPTAESN